MQPLLFMVMQLHLSGIETACKEFGERREDLELE